MQTDTDLETTIARGAPMIDGELRCWRCDSGTDDAGFCPACGAVTIPAGVTSPPLSSSTSAVGRRPIAAALELDPQPFDALVLGLAAFGSRG